MVALNRRRMSATGLTDRVRLLLGDRRSSPRTPAKLARGYHAHDIAGPIARLEQPAGIRIAGVAQALQQLATDGLGRQERKSQPRHDRQTG